MQSAQFDHRRALRHDRSAADIVDDAVALARVRRDPMRVAAVDLTQPPPRLHLRHLERVALDTDLTSRKVAERESVKRGNVLRINMRRSLKLFGDGNRRVSLRKLRIDAGNDLVREVKDASVPPSLAAARRALADSRTARSAGCVPHSPLKLLPPLPPLPSACESHTRGSASLAYCASPALAPLSGRGSTM